MATLILIGFYPHVFALVALSECLSLSVIQLACVTSTLQADWSLWQTAVFVVKDCLCSHWWLQVCVRACVCACARACVCMCVCVRNHLLQCLDKIRFDTDAHIHAHGHSYINELNTKHTIPWQNNTWGYACMCVPAWNLCVFDSVCNFVCVCVCEIGVLS